jgi:D-alanyl-D-alanine carboxypeptidase
MLGLAICAPTPADAAQKTARKKTSTTTVRKPASRTARTQAYSASASRARKARLARARAAARAREAARMRALHEAMTPRYKTDANGDLVPDVRAAAAIIFNPANGEVLWQENAQDKRSIASITKVMTTVVFLEDNPDLSQEVTVERSDVYAASTTYLRANERLPLSEVLHLVLIASDNAAARILARVSHGGTASY